MAFKPSITAHGANRRIESLVSMYPNLTSLCPRVLRAAGATVTTNPRALAGTGISMSKQPAKQSLLPAAFGRADQNRFAAAAAPVSFAGGSAALRLDPSRSATNVLGITPPRFKRAQSARPSSNTDIPASPLRGNQARSIGPAGAEQRRDTAFARRGRPQRAEPRG